MAKLRFDTPGLRFDEPKKLDGLRFDEPEVPNYGDTLRAAKTEIDRLNAEQLSAGRQELSAGAQAALTDQFRQQDGFEPTQPQMGELNTVDYGAEAEAEQGPVADFLTAPAQALTGIGTGIVGAFSPETAQRMQQNIDSYYGTGAQTVGGRFYGGTIGTAANIIGAMPAGAVGMAGIYGASGAGSTRTDIADRRDDGQTITGGEEAKAAGLIGAAEGLSGLITGGILNRARGIFNGVGTGVVTREAGAKGIRELIRREVPELITEVGEEMATQLFTNAVRKNTYAEEQKLSDGVLEAGLMSVIPVLTGRAVASRRPQARSEAATKQQIKEGKQEIGPMPAGDFITTDNVSEFETQTLGSEMPLSGQVETVGSEVQSVIPSETVGVEQGEVFEQTNLAENDPGLQMYVDDLARQPIFEGQVGRQEAVPGKIVGPDTQVVGSQESITQEQFPARLDTPIQVAEFFGAMEKDSEILAAYSNEPMVLVDIPVTDIPNQEIGVEGEIQESKLERIRQGDPATQPPIMAVDGGTGLFIPDGNHRVMVARERGAESLKGYVPESVAEERGYSVGAGTVSTPIIPTTIEAPTAVELETVGADATTGAATTAGPTEFGPQFGRGSKGNPIFPSAFPKPTAKQLVSLAGTAERPTPIGRFMQKMKTMLRDPVTGALGSIEGRKIEAKGRNTLAALEVRRVTRELNKVAKKHGIGINKDTDIQMALEAALRGKEVADPRVRKVLQRYRKAIDASSQTLADAQKAAGVDATVIENNIGTYVQNNPAGLCNEGPKSLPQVKVSEWDGEAVYGKYDTVEDAVNARDALVKARKERMIRKGAKDRGVSDADLNGRAAKGISIEEPISQKQREETEIHDVRYLTTKTVLDNLHNASVIDLHVAAGATYGQAPPKMLKQHEVPAWANERNLVPLPGKGVLHNLDTYIPKEVATRLDEYTYLPSGVNEFLLKTVVRPWKAAMTIFRPATWGRNLIGSQIHAVLDGASIFDPRNYPAYGRAIQELARGEQSLLVRRLIERGALDSDYSVTEARDVALRVGRSGTVTDALMGGWGTFKGAAAKGYQYPDNLAKVASVLIHQKRDGMSLDDAVLEMEKYQPIYPRISRLAKIARDNVFLGAPFVSYMDQSFRNVSRAIAPLGPDGGISLNPNLQRVGMLLMVPYMIDQLSRAAIGMDEEDDRILERDDPASYFIKTLVSPVMYNPFTDDGRDPKGRAVALNLRYITPIIHDILPSMNNGSLQIPYGVSGPIIDTLIEQITGKERFSGFDFLNDEMSMKEQAIARGDRLLDTLVPLPPEVKRAAPRVRKAVAGEGEEPVANALLATLTGIDTRTPYVAERIVKEMINNAIDIGEAGEALAILRLWNDTYKPGNKKKLDPAKVIGGYKSSLRSKRANAIRKAGDALFLGKHREAERLIAKYNRDRGERAPELMMGSVEGAVSTERKRGRDY